MNELIQAYEDYIKMLGDEIGELACWATTHGWQSSRIEEGKRMRERIKNIKAVLEQQNLLIGLSDITKKFYPNGFPESLIPVPEELKRKPNKKKIIKNLKKYSKVIKKNNYDSQLDILKNGDHKRG